jgi:transcriptional regulator with XRE-family HTH domain
MAAFRRSSQYLGRAPPPKVPATTSPEARAVGRRIREFRTLKDWTQEELAEAADLDRAYVAGMEVGLRNPSLRNLVKIARALGVPLAEIPRFDCAYSGC